MRILCFLSVLFLLASCSETTAEPIDLSGDLGYYPLDLDRELIYDQDSILVINTVRGIVYDTARSQVREVLVERFESVDGSTTFRGERYQRAAADQPWTFVQTFTVQRSSLAIKRTDDNLTFTKLTFPIRPGRNWDGNIEFDATRQFVVGGEFLDVYNNWDYRYAQSPLDTTINGIDLEATWRVNQANVDNLIDRRVAFERYAPGIGLVERFIDARHTQCQVCCGGDLASCSDLPWSEKAEKGFILHQTIRSVL